MASRAFAVAHLSPARTLRAGFTLLEIVVAIALAALVTGVAIVNFDTSFGGIDARPPDEIFRSAVRQARFEAAMRQQRTYLTYDAEKNALVIVDNDGNPCGERPFTNTMNGEKFEIEFFPIRPEEAIGTADKNEPSQYPIAKLVFDPCGCGIPVKVSIKGAGERLEFILDPFYWGAPPARRPE